MTSDILNLTKARDKIYKKISTLKKNKIFDLKLESEFKILKLKTGKITPIHRSGDSKDIQNHRTITVVCTFYKIIEITKI